MLERTRSLFSSRILARIFWTAALPATLAAQAPLQFGVIYQCPAGQSFKVYSCASADASAACDTQAFNGAQPGQRGPAPRGQVMALLQLCHVQSPAEAQAAARGGPPAGQASSNGIKVGDQVEVVTGFGWTPAKVLAINGNSYRVLTNGVTVTKDYPSEVRRLGGATAQDHAAGQYRVGDRVQVNFEGRWVESKVVTQMNMEYQVEVPGNRLVWAKPENLRPSTAPPPAPPKSGVPPQAGMVSCAGKFEGRYASTGGFGTVTITFRSGKAIVPGINGDETLECWMRGDKMILHEPGKPELDMPIDINNDGTLQTPLGEIKKKGN